MELMFGWNMIKKPELLQTDLVEQHHFHVFFSTKSMGTTSVPRSRAGTDFPAARPGRIAGFQAEGSQVVKWGVVWPRTSQDVFFSNGGRNNYMKI